MAFPLKQPYNSLHVLLVTSFACNLGNANSLCEEDMPVVETLSIVLPAKTKCIDTTITNIIEGKVIYTPENSSLASAPVKPRSPSPVSVFHKIVDFFLYK